jgi:nitrite reductase (NADH) large subunit
VDGRSTPRRRLVVVGNGMAGARLADEIGRRAPGGYDVTVFGAEAVPAYNRILLSAVLAGDKRVDEIFLAPPRGAGAATVVSGDPVTAIDRSARQVRTARGRVADYDVLVLATGSTPIVPAIPGATLSGVVTFRDINDVTVMTAAAARRGHAVVIGGGLLGLEAAEGLRRRGMTVTVLHLMSALMERQLDGNAAALLQSSLEARGLSFGLEADTAEIVGADRVSGVKLKDGRVIPADLVVIAVGIRPNAELGRAAGLTCGRGIVVDDAMRSSDPSIYAVGECVEHRGRSYGLVAPLWEQVDVCAARLAGDTTAAYAGSTFATSLKVAGVDVYSAGELSAPDGEEIVLRDSRRGVYRKLMVRDGRLTGAVLYGDVADGAWYLDLMREGRPIDSARSELIFGKAFAGDLVAGGVT